MKSKKINQGSLLRPFSKTFNRGDSLRIRAAKKHLRFSHLEKTRRQSYFIVARSYGRLSDSEIESVRKVIRRSINKRRDRVFVRIFASVPLTQKPTQARMGKGKGTRSGDRICFVKPGKVLFEVETSKRTLARLNLLRVFEKVMPRLSIPVNFASLKELYFQ